MCNGHKSVWVVLALFLPFGAVAANAELRDPLRPPGPVSASAPSSFNAAAWRLSSTLVAEGRRVAIINDRPVRVGDRVGGARVLAIDAGRVQLDYRGRRFTINRPAAAMSKR